MSKSNRIDRDAPAWRIAMLWGSNAAFARALERTHSTTQKWLEQGDIPVYEQEGVIAAAKRDKKKLTPDMFVDRRKFEVAPADPVGLAPYAGA